MLKEANPWVSEVEDFVQEEQLIEKQKVILASSGESST
jgi:hypothetical protein